jgi:hypothetical protein
MRTHHTSSTLILMLVISVAWLLLLMGMSHTRRRRAARQRLRSDIRNSADARVPVTAEVEALEAEVAALLAQLRTPDASSGVDVAEGGAAETGSGDRSVSAAALERQAAGLTVMLQTCRQQLKGDSSLLDPAESERRRLEKFRSGLRDEVVKNRGARKVPQR